MLGEDVTEKVRDSGAGIIYLRIFVNPSLGNMK